VKGIQSENIVSTMNILLYSSDKPRAKAVRARPANFAARSGDDNLWPYERVIREANPLGVMCSYNDFDGVQSRQPLLLTDVLRREWASRLCRQRQRRGGISRHQHHVATDYKDAVRNPSWPA